MIFVTQSTFQLIFVKTYANAEGQKGLSTIIGGAVVIALQH